MLVLIPEPSQLPTGADPFWGHGGTDVVFQVTLLDFLV